MSGLVRHLPPLNAVLERRAVRGLQRRLRRSVVVQLVREAIAAERVVLGSGKGLESRYGTSRPDRPQLLRTIEAEVLRHAETLRTPALQPVINATGVLLHTNLGRARLAPEVAHEVARVAQDPVALEMDLGSGRRSQRAGAVQRWLRLLTGAPDAVVVNNGAAALWLAVHGLARRRRAVISRGELVAIGGSFRVPDLLATTGARMVEVGTTNKTRLRDYARELRAGDVVVKVHPSNYSIEGFTESVGLSDLAQLCHERGARLIFDAGSGSLYNFGKFGLTGEEPITSSLRDGADLVTFSGDKLLGGPQAGILLGTLEAIRPLAKHPVLRAMRCDKMILSALEATLRIYGEGREAELPLLAAMGTPQAELKRRAQGLRDTIQTALPDGWSTRIERSHATPGGGSFATGTVSSWSLRLEGPSDRQAHRLRDRLRRGEPAVLTRVSDAAVHVDLRGPTPDEVATIADRLVAELAEVS